MKKFFLLCVVLIFFAACAEDAPAADETTADEAIEEATEPTPEAEPRPEPNIHGKLTRIEYGNNVAYIIGSMHAGRPNWFPLADITEEAMARADVFAFEFDMSALQNIEQLLEMDNEDLLRLIYNALGYWEELYEFFADAVEFTFDEFFDELHELFLLSPDEMLEWLILQDTLAEVLPHDILSNFLEHLPSYGIEFAAISHMSPLEFTLWFGMEITPHITDVQDEYSVDDYVYNFAVRMGRQVVGLNHILIEYLLFTEIPAEIEPYMLADFVSFEELVEFHREYNLADAYEAQDLDFIREIILRELGSADDNPYAQHFQLINLYVRCHIFANGIASLLRDTPEPTTFFITIGMAHILGDGAGKVLCLLEDMGFELTPLWQ